MLGSLTPCFTIPPTPFSVSIPSGLPSIAPSTTIIPDKIFALQYPLQQPTNKGGVSSNAKIGIEVLFGIAFFLVIIYLVFLWFRRSRRVSSPKREPPLRHINLHPAIPKIAVKPRTSNNNVAQKFNPNYHMSDSNPKGEFDGTRVSDRELAGDLSDASRYSDKENLELEVIQPNGLILRDKELS
jgi:hypothetical protein